MDLSQTLLQLEQRLLSQATRRDAEKISNLLADDFIEFSASGGVWSKADVVDQLPHEPFFRRSISQFSIKSLSEESALATYLCRAESHDQSGVADSLRSSIWRKRGEQWQMVFHQGTLIPG